MQKKTQNPKLMVAVAAFAAFLATFNETYMNIAFAPIMDSLHIGVSTVQWLATAYMLGAAVMVPVSAFVYRTWRTKPLFLFTVALLIIGSVIGALAQSFAVLLAGRIVQAIGTGLLIPVGMNVTLEIAPKKELGIYMGLMGAMTTLGPSSSVIVAGALLSVADWHVMLWVFAGLAFLCFLSGAVFLGNIAALTRPKLDAASVALIGVALVGILYGVSTAFSGEIIAAVLALAAGALCLALFLSRQKKLKEPLIDLRPLSVAQFRAGTVINMLSLVTIFAMNILIPVFSQSVLGISSMTASLMLFPAILASCVMSPIAGRICDKRGVGALLPGGFALIAVFSASLSFFIPGGNAPLIALLYIPVIVGSALIIGPVQSFALSALPGGLNPHGVTILSTGFQIAGCIGSSLFTGVYAAATGMRASSGADVASASADAFLASGLLVAVFALAGLLLSVRARKYRAARHEGQAAAQETPMGEAVPVLASIMKTDVYSLKEEAKVIDALRLFLDKRISGAPIVNHAGAPVGFISDGDIMRYLADQHPLFETAWSFVLEQRDGNFQDKLDEMMALPVSEVAHRKVISVRLNETLGAVSKILARHDLKKAPVIDNGKMVGVINRSNITRLAVTRYLQGAEPGGVPAAPALETP
ncbi:MAG: MFS transporter [Clostridiales Family XIII bacterium]|nr:MFS transporter [Clostridiales Family XIII bacterium]